MLLPSVLTLSLAALLAGPLPTPQALLRGKSVPLPAASDAGGKRHAINLLLTAQKDVLLATLLSRGWTPRDANWTAPVMDLRVKGALPELDLEASGPAIDLRYNLRLWRAPQEVLGAPLWLAVASRERGIEPLQSQPPALEPGPTAVNRVLADLSYGASQARRARLSDTAIPALPWVELRAGPEEGAHHLADERVDAVHSSSVSPAPRKLPLPPPVSRPPEVLDRIAGAGPRVALTFDACSTLDRSQYDQKVIDTLRKHQVPATLFLSGRWAETHVPQTLALAAEPLFEIGNHSYIHPHLTAVPPDRQRDELWWTQQILYSFTGKVPRFFRPPYGQWNESVAAQAGALGLVTVEYDVASGDPDPQISRERLAQWVVKRTKPGSVIVMHMNRRGRHTAESLPAIIKGLRARGFVLSTVGQMVDAATASGTTAVVPAAGAAPRDGGQTP